MLRKRIICCLKIKVGLYKIRSKFIWIVKKFLKLKPLNFLELLLIIDSTGNIILIAYVIKYPKILALFSLLEEYLINLLFYHYIIHSYTHISFTVFMYGDLHMKPTWENWKFYRKRLQELYLEFPQDLTQIRYFPIWKYWSSITSIVIMLPFSCINWHWVNYQIYFLCLYFIPMYMNMVPDKPIIIIYHHVGLIWLKCHYHFRDHKFGMNLCWTLMLIVQLVHLRIVWKCTLLLAGIRIHNELHLMWKHLISN